MRLERILLGRCESQCTNLSTFRTLTRECQLGLSGPLSSREDGLSCWWCFSGHGYSPRARRMAAVGVRFSSGSTKECGKRSARQINALTPKAGVKKRRSADASIAGAACQKMKTAGRRLAIAPVWQARLQFRPSCALSATLVPMEVFATRLTGGHSGANGRKSAGATEQPRAFSAPVAENPPRPHICGSIVRGCGGGMADSCRWRTAASVAPARHGRYWFRRPGCGRGAYAPPHRHHSRRARLCAC